MLQGQYLPDQVDGTGTPLQPGATAEVLLDEHRRVVTVTAVGEGGDASAANQATEIAQLASILTAVSNPLDWVPVTKSDATVLTGVIALWVNAAGTIAVQNALGTTRTIPFLAPDTYYPLGGVTKILLSGSTIADADIAVWKATAT